MHRCLQIPEILYIILDFLIYDGHPHRGRARLHALAVMKACRAFREPAAQRLWKYLFNIVPLITTMPDDLWEVTDREGFQCKETSSKSLVFKRAVRPSDWTRFDMYAGYIRGIGLFGLSNEKSWTASVVLDDNVIFELKRRTMPILPNLETMAILTNDLALAPTLFSPRLQRLRLIMRAREVKWLIRLVTALPVFAPYLRSLELHPSGPWLRDEFRPIQPVLAAALRQLDLKEFICRWRGAVTEEMLFAILHMPSLSKLSVMIDLKTIHAALLSNPTRDFRLSRLSVDAATVTTDLIPKIITALTGSNVEAFAIFGNSPDKPSDLEDITSTVGRHCSPARLVELELQYGNSALAAATFNSLRPLLPFGSLQYVILTSHLFSLSDKDAKMLAQSWPQLEILMLAMSGPDSPTVHGTLTLRGMLWFAKYCKNLKALSVDFKYPPPETESETKEGIDNETLAESDAAAVANNNTWYLGVGKSVISEPRPVASFLRALFPQLVLLTWAGTPDLSSDNEKHWLAVEGMIRGGGSPDQET